MHGGDDSIAHPSGTGVGGPVNLTERRGGPAGLSYVRGLDGLRAIAVSAVVLFHATETWLRGGFLGVDVFFVLSGYLITSQILSEWREWRRVDILAFWRRRARRILAALYLLLAFTLAFALVARPDEVAVFRGDALAALAYIANWYFIFHNQPYFETVAHPSPLIHLWSLGVEEQFYLVWPLILAPALLLLRRWTAALIFVGAAASCLLMAALYQPTVDPSRVYYGTDTHASGLLIGALLSFFWSPRPRSGRPRRRLGASLNWLMGSLDHFLLLDGLALVALAVLGYAFVALNESQSILYRGGFTVVAVVTALCVVAVSHPRARLVARVLELTPIRWLGRRSYSIYLWHWPVIVFTRPQIDVHMAGYPLLLLRIVLTLVFAELSFRLVEEPVRRGALVRLWRYCRDASRLRQWRRLAAPAATGVALAGVLVGIGIAAAQARVPAPPPYLAVTSVDTIVRSTAVSPGKSQAALPAPSETPSPATGSIQAATVVAADPAATAVTSALADAGGGTPTLSGSSGVQIPDPPETPISAGTVIAIGDSVMLGAVPQLAAAIDGIQVNATVSRQVSTGIALLQELRGQGVIGEVMIIGLGSNGTFTNGQFDQIMSILADVPKVIFVNVKVPRSWEQSNDSVIDEGVPRYPNARLVDWYDASASHPEFFQADEYHLRADGATAYASLIAAAITAP
jgi:peptidoglycan/LPS O-acetylase OafA/YrhL